MKIVILPMKALVLLAVLLGSPPASRRGPARAMNARHDF